MICALEYIHSNNIIFRDLKPENLLIDKNGYLKLIDFGFAKVVKSRTYTLCGTPEYFAPEMLLNLGHGKAADWWAVGVLLYEMIVGVDPFNDEDPMTIYRNILKARLKFSSKVSSKAKSLIKHLIVVDLTKRYGNLKNGVDDIKNHKLFNELDFNKLLIKKLLPTYIPKIKNSYDTIHLNIYTESFSEASEVNKLDDPFFDLI